MNASLRTPNRIMPSLYRHPLSLRERAGVRRYFRSRMARLTPNLLLTREGVNVPTFILVDALKVLLSLVAVAALASGTAQAAVTSVSPSPTSAQAALTNTTSIAVGWNVVSSAGGNVGSVQGVFRGSGGEVLGTVNQPINKSIVGPGVATFSETIQVPTDVAYRAHKMGLANFLYERSFNDGGGAAAGAVTVHITTTSSAGFGISRLALTFDNGEALRLAARDEKLRVAAEISHTGTGLLRASWEIAGPNPNGQKPQWRTLAAVTQGLAGDPDKVISPLLPTTSTGTYLVRLRITEPAFAFETPIVHYSVIEKKN